MPLGRDRMAAMARFYHRMAIERHNNSSACQRGEDFATHINDRSKEIPSLSDDL